MANTATRKKDWKGEPAPLLHTVQVGGKKMDAGDPAKKDILKPPSKNG